MISPGYVVDPRVLGDTQILFFTLEDGRRAGRTRQLVAPG